MDWGPIIAGAAAGLGSGTLATVVAPWVQKAVDERRDVREHRRQLIVSWREMVARNHRPREIHDDMLDDLDYISLRGHLDESVRRQLEEARTTIVSPDSQGIAVNVRLKMIVEEIDRLEREWNLI